MQLLRRRIENYRTNNVRSYARRRNLAFAAISLAITAISYIGCPPPKIKYVNAPIELKKRLNTGYDTDKFARINNYDGRTRLCSIISTTSVRNYFDNPPGEFVERTRINREVCKVPSNSSTLDAVVTLPYEPEQASVEHSMDSCAPFKATAGEWRSECQVQAANKNIYLLAYENTPTSNKPTGHERKADRIDIQIVK